jgi:hypothetical protein
MNNCIVGIYLKINPNDNAMIDFVCKIHIVIVFQNFSDAVYPGKSLRYVGMF